MVARRLFWLALACLGCFACAPGTVRTTSTVSDAPDETPMGDPPPVVTAQGEGVAEACEVADRHEQPLPSAGVAFLDLNEDGRMQSDERGLANVAISDGLNVYVTTDDGRFSFDAALDTSLLKEHELPIVQMTVPSGYRATTSWYARLTGSKSDGAIRFGLVLQEQPRPFTFILVSDTHFRSDGLNNLGVAPYQPFIDQAQAVDAAFVVDTGDSVHADAFGVEEDVLDAWRDYLDMFAAIDKPAWRVPGNHDLAGVRRDGLTLRGWSLDDANFAYGMFWNQSGPIRASFEYGGVHFVLVDFITRPDPFAQDWIWHPSESAFAWLEQDLGRLPADMPVCVFTHGKTPELLDRLASMSINLVAVLHGHHHSYADYVETTHGIRVIRTLDLCPRHEMDATLPAVWGYTLLTIAENAAITSQLVRLPSE